jgi:hypothetical protein
MQIKYAIPPTQNTTAPMQTEQLTQPNRVRTLTGKEIELDIESDYKVRPAIQRARRVRSAAKSRRRALETHHHPNHRANPTTIPYHASSRSTADPRSFRKQVQRIKERVEEKEGIPPQQQRLIYGGKQM